MREKAELKDRVDELEHRCIQLSGETDTIGEMKSHAVLQGGACMDPVMLHFIVL